MLIFWILAFRLCAQPRATEFSNQAEGGNSTYLQSFPVYKNPLGYIERRASKDCLCVEGRFICNAPWHGKSLMSKFMVHYFLRILYLFGALVFGPVFFAGTAANKSGRYVLGSRDFNFTLSRKLFKNYSNRSWPGRIPRPVNTIKRKEVWEQGGRNDPLHNKTITDGPTSPFLCTMQLWAEELALAPFLAGGLVAGFFRWAASESESSELDACKSRNNGRHKKNPRKAWTSCHLPPAVSLQCENMDESVFGERAVRRLLPAVPPESC